MPQWKNLCANDWASSEFKCSAFCRLLCKITEWSKFIWGMYSIQMTRRKGFSWTSLILIQKRDEQRSRRSSTRESRRKRSRRRRLTTGWSASILFSISLGEDQQTAVTMVTTTSHLDHRAYDLMLFSADIQQFNWFQHHVSSRNKLEISCE